VSFLHGLLGNAVGCRIYISPSALLAGPRRRVIDSALARGRSGSRGGFQVAAAGEGVR